jgi:hypothetical protein
MPKAQARNGAAIPTATVAPATSTSNPNPNPNLKRNIKRSLGSDSDSSDEEPGSGFGSSPSGSDVSVSAILEDTGSSSNNGVACTTPPQQAASVSPVLEGAELMDATSCDLLTVENEAQRHPRKQTQKQKRSKPQSSAQRKLAYADSPSRAEKENSANGIDVDCDHSVVSLAADDEDTSELHKGSDRAFEKKATSQLTWTCEMCTYSNAAVFTDCQMCETTRTSGEVTKRPRRR